MVDSIWLDRKGAAQYLSLRVELFSRKVRAGVIPKGIKNLGHPRWRVSDLEAVMRGVDPNDPLMAVEALAEEIRTKAQSRSRSSTSAR